MSKKITPQEIAASYHWDGEWIFSALCDALTDANFHDLRARLESSFADWLWQEQEKARLEKVAE
jgi:hypothetical protein